MVCKRAVWLMVLGMVSLSALGALEVSRGKVRFRINENTGRFSVYYAPDLSVPRFQSLFFADDPTTSLVTLQLDGEAIPLVPGRDFKLRVEESPTGVTAAWTGTRLNVTQSFDFLSSPGSGVADGLRITFVLNNPTPRNIRGALKFLLDTHLGEPGIHFVLKDGRNVTSELVLSGSEVQGWSSAAPGAPASGLLLSLDSQASVPSRIHFSNWKRLSEGGWELTPVVGRGFNNLPYSVNDSAVSIYYNNLALGAGETVKIVMNFGNSGAPTFEGAVLGTDNAFSDILDNTRTYTAEDLKAQLQKDQAVVDDLLLQIDQGLASSKEITPQDVEILGAILEELKRRKPLYTEK